MPQPRVQARGSTGSSQFIGNYTLQPGETLRDCIHPALLQLPPTNGGSAYRVIRTGERDVTVLYTQRALEACGEMLGRQPNNPRLRDPRFEELNNYLIERKMVTNNGVRVQHLPPVSSGTPPNLPQPKPSPSRPFTVKYKLGPGDQAGDYLHPAVLEFKPVNGELPYKMTQNGNDLTITYTDEALKACGKMLAQQLPNAALRDPAYLVLNDYLLRKGYVRTFTGAVLKSLPPLEMVSAPPPVV